MSAKGNRQNMVSFADQEASYSGDDFDVYDGDRHLNKVDEFDDAAEFNKNFDFDEEIKVQKPVPKKMPKIVRGISNMTEKQVGISIVKNEPKTLQNPDDMVIILPPRRLPSDEEMYREYYRFLWEERKKKYELSFSDMILKGWTSRRDATEKEEDLKKRKATVFEWFHKVRRDIPPRCIKKLTSARDWVFDEKLMIGWREILTEISRPFAERKAIQEDNYRTFLERKKEQKEAKERVFGVEPKSYKRGPRSKGSNRGMCALSKGNNGATKKRDKKDENGLTVRQREKLQAQVAWDKACREAQEKKAAEPKVEIVKHDIDEDVIPDLPDELESFQQEISEEKEELNRLLQQTIDITEMREKREAEQKELEDEAADNERRFLGMVSKSIPKKERKKAKKVLVKIEAGFIGLIDQHKGITEKKEQVRSVGFSSLASKEKMEVVLAKTSMCRSIVAKKKCHHKKCRYAHSANELKPAKCMFGDECRLVKKLPNGDYSNTGKSKSGKYCHTIHPSESLLSYSRRMGYPYTEPTSGIEIPKPSEPVQLTEVETKAPALDVQSIPVEIVEIESKDVDEKSSQSHGTKKMMCRLILAKKKCPAENCRYAHTVNELVHTKCMFGNKCRLIKKCPDGQYKNFKLSKSGNYCHLFHPEETAYGYSKRMGYTYVQQPAQVVLKKIVTKNSDIKTQTNESLLVEKTNPVVEEKVQVPKVQWASIVGKKKVVFKKPPKKMPTGKIFPTRPKRVIKELGQETYEEKEVQKYEDPEPVQEQDPEPVQEQDPEPVQEQDPEPVQEQDPEPVLESPQEQDPEFQKYEDPEPVQEPSPEQVQEQVQEPVQVLYDQDPELQKYEEPDQEPEPVPPQEVPEPVPPQEVPEPVPPIPPQVVQKPVPPVPPQFIRQSQYYNQPPQRPQYCHQTPQLRQYYHQTPQVPQYYQQPPQRRYQLPPEYYQKKARQEAASVSKEKIEEIASDRKQVVIRTSRKNAEKAIECAIKNGIPNFRIELTD